MVYGANVQGSRAGVYGESVRAETDRESQTEGVGVWGSGDNFGVVGRVQSSEAGSEFAGVVGQHPRAGVGAVGVSLDRPDLGGGVGVAGLSHTSMNPQDLGRPLPDPAGGSGTGVFGSSGSGAGVRGTSRDGQGGSFQSKSGPGVSGKSSSGRGGVFDSGQTAGGSLVGQVGLVPQTMPVPGVVPASPVKFDSSVLESLPREGRGGDLLVTQGQDDRCTLWFCSKSQEGETPAVWSQVLLATPVASQEAEFTDWTAVIDGVAHGTLLGSSVMLSGTIVTAPPNSVVDGSFTAFNRADFTPPLPTTDAIHFIGSTGNSYTLEFGSAVTDPILHLGSLGSTLHFATGTQITEISGDEEFSVLGSDVVGKLQGPTDDANGTVRLSGTFFSITFSTTCLVETDGIFLQVGASPHP